MVQFLSFVCSTGGKGCKFVLRNLQNLGAVPPQTPPKSGGAMKGGTRSKIIEGLGTRLFEPEGYKMGPLLAKMVNKVNNDI